MTEKRLTITEARRVCEKIGAHQVVLVAFFEGSFAAVSYGETKAACAAVRPLCDEIADNLLAGTLPAPTYDPR